MKTLADLKRELDSMETTTPKMKSIDDTLQTLVSDMESFRLRSFSGGTKQMQIRCSSRLPQQVPYSTLESCHSVTATGNRVMLNELGNSDSLLPQIEMPVFDGTNPSMWLSKVERFFSIGRYTEEAKLDLVFLSLEGVALKWFLREKFRDWTSFEHRLLARFEPVQIHSSPEVFMPTKLIHVFAYETKSRYTTELIEEDESSALKKSNPEDNEANNSFDSKLKFGAYKVFDKMLIRSHNLQQRRKLRLSPKNRMFKFKNRNLQRNRS